MANVVFGAYNDIVFEKINEAVIDMMNDGIRSSNGGFLPERKNYSRFVSQAAKNTVKKKLMEIRRSGARTADEIIDFLLKSGDKSHAAGVKRTNAFDFAETIRSEVEINRNKWRNFLIELATRFDPEILASFGVNFVYGGILTSSCANVGWASVLRLGEGRNFFAGAGGGTDRGALSGGGVRKVSEILSRGRAKGSMVWIVEGSGAFASEMMDLYRYEPEIAFILLANSDKNTCLSAFEELSKLKNVLAVIDENDREALSKWSKTGMLYAVCSGKINKREGHCGDAQKSIMSGKIPLILENFIKNPSFPIRADGIFEAFNCIETLLSGGSSVALPEYRL